MYIKKWNSFLQLSNKCTCWKKSECIFNYLVRPPLGINNNHCNIINWCTKLNTSPQEHNIFFVTSKSKKWSLKINKADCHIYQYTLELVLLWYVTLLELLLQFWFLYSFKLWCWSKPQALVRLQIGLSLVEVNSTVLWMNMWTNHKNTTMPSLWLIRLWLWSNKPAITFTGQK